jgi:hypothetical protein
MSVGISPVSRLLFNQLLSISGFEFWDTLDLPDFVARPGDLKHRVDSSDRIDVLAFQYYNDAGFWWVIAWANGMEILPTDLKADHDIVIPDPDFIINSFLPAPTTQQQS